MAEAERPERRLSNGQFAKGNPRPKGAGRQKGTPNGTTRAVKEFLAALVDDAEVQQGVRDRIVAGDAVAFFRALDHVVGKPVEQMEHRGEIRAVLKWQK